MSFVLDCSATLAFCFSDERTPAVEAISDRVFRDGAIAPRLWRYEVANGLLVAQRRKRIDEAFRNEIINMLVEACIDVDHEGDTHIWSTTLRLATEYKLTVYDAAYLELAQRKRLPLATLDDALAKAATAAGVETLG